jgi:thioredoxin-like negative regulator of GroEL
MRPSFRPSSPPRSDSDTPPSAGHYDQEFLYHLYRGSELLSENAVDEAKAELERALALQPRDTEGQGLLGVVYFRLGMYPMAIEIFEQLERSCPGEVTVKINLALCYLKTGQGEAARSRLEQVVARSPAHKRAWGYLGLVYQRFGEFEKARVAFEKAGHPKLAQRMAQLVSQLEADASDELPEIDTAHHVPARPTLRPSLGPSLREQQPGSILPPPESVAPAHVPAPPPLGPTIETSTVAPAAAARLGLPEPVTRVVREAELIFPENPKVALHRDGSVMVRVDTSFAVRPQWISLSSYQRVPFATQPLKRRSSHGQSAEPLGGAAPIVALVGAGRLLLSPHPDTRLLLFAVDRDPVYLRENHLVGFQPQVSYESGQLDPRRAGDAITKLSGTGSVIVYTRGRLGSVPVTPDVPVCVRAGHLLGWTGQLLPRVIPQQEATAALNDLVGFSGHGAVLIDMS